MKAIINQCNKIRSEVEKLLNQHHSNLEDLKIGFQKVSTPLSKYELGWAGQWMNKNFNYYYKDFDSDSDYYYQLDMNDLREFIEEEIGIHPNKLINDLKPIINEYRGLKELIITELSILKEIEKFNKEADVFEKIEKFQFGISQDDWIRGKKPNSFVVDGRNLDLMNRGTLNVPPHIGLEGEIFSSISQLMSIDNLNKLVNRLLRQIEIKSQIDEEVSRDSEELKNRLSNLFEKFHSITRQLRNRYNNRSTIIIQDEYDVQDLIHALLKIDFNDVRPEEYTPSYAGSSSRVDFLLKGERTVIEIKKTRSGLKDKEIGNQLILDVARYKWHPDCDRLVCFVYDPEGLIGNPRGLEDDLETNSSEELLVEVYIRP